MSTSIELFVHELGIDTRNAEKTAASFPADIQAGEPAAVFVYKGDSETIEVLAGETGRFATVLDIVENGTYAVANGSQIRDGSGNYVANQFTTFVNDSSGASVGLATMADLKIGVPFDSTYNGVGTLDSTSNLGYSNIVAQSKITSSLDSVADPGIDLLDSATLTNQMLKFSNITGQRYPQHYHQNLTSLQSTIVDLHPTSSGTNVQDSAGGQWSYTNIVRTTKDGLEALNMTSRSYGLGTWNQSVAYPNTYTMYLLVHLNNDTGNYKTYYMWDNSSYGLIWIHPNGNVGTYNGTYFNQYIDRNSWQRIILQGTRSGTSGSGTQFKLWINGNGPYTKTTTGPSSSQYINYYYSYSSYYPQYVAMSGIVEGSSDEIAMHLENQMKMYQDPSASTAGTSSVQNISTISDSGLGTGMPYRLPPNAIYDINTKIASLDSANSGHSLRRSGLELKVGSISESNFLDPLQLTEVMDETGKIFVGRGIDIAMNEFGFSSGTILSSPSTNSFDAMVSPINRISHTKDTPFYSPTSAQASSMSLTIAEEAPIAFFKDSLGMGHGNRFELLTKLNDPRLEQEPIQQSQTSGPVQIWY